MPLSEMQQRFKAHIFASGAEDSGLEDIFETGRIALEERLSVYRGNILGSLAKVLSDNFPLVENLVGAQFMSGMSRAYIKAHPPQGGCLNDYGADFPAFIAEFELAKALPYLPDVARFEWAVHSAYYAADDLPLRAEDLAAIPEETLGDLKLRLRDHVKLLDSPYPLTAIRDFCKNPQGTLNLDQGGEKLLICRPQLKVEVMALDEPSFALLECLQRGEALGDAVETVLSKHEGFDFQAFLQTQLKLETFLEFETNK